MTSEAELARYIDWTPFFQTWELKGRYPAILDREAGRGGAPLFEDAQAMLKKIIDEKWFNPKAVIGFWPANSVGDDIRLYHRRGRKRARDLLHTAPAADQARRQANVALSDFIAPKSGEAGLSRRLRRHRRHRGSGDRRALRTRQRRLFVDHGQGAGRPFRRGLCRAHARAVRKEFWGYAPDENLAPMS
jgi:5-methyltetrahydrofolate--homocysteine methyltransferase